MLLEAHKGVAGVISAAIGIICEHLHRNRGISEALLGFRSRLRFLIVGVRAGAGCLKSHFHPWRASQWRLGSNVPKQAAQLNTSPDYKLVSQLGHLMPLGTPWGVQSIHVGLAGMARGQGLLSGAGCQGHTTFPCRH